MSHIILPPIRRVIDGEEVECRYIEGMENMYMATEGGDIIDIRVPRVYRPVPKTVETGYQAVHLTDLRDQYLVHRLVAQLFCPGYLPGAEVVHRDGDKTNNRAKNLMVKTGGKQALSAVCKTTEQMADERDARRAKMAARDILRLEQAKARAARAQKKQAQL